MQDVILLTGAGKGIGKAIALDFSLKARNNPSFTPVLILCSRTYSDIASVAEKCAALGTKAVPIEADIATIDDIDRLVGQILQEFGTIDCLINNAGVGRFKDLSEFTEEDFDYTMSVNMKGTFFLTQKIFHVMEQKRSGHIFFITSIAAEMAFKSSSVYSMSKFGQKGLAETLRLYGRECNVRITNVMPGAVYTPMWGDAAKDLKQVMMMPEDIAGPVVDAYLQPSRTAVEEIVLRPVGGDINS
ncbi:MAG: SDR family oxidoreductase [Chlorobiales bacterium]|nr:SDR family oxidoreductase [Chlorobiales bacterium]